MGRATILVLALAFTPTYAVVEAGQTIDLGGTWRFPPDDQADGHQRGWHTETISDADWDSVKTGASWESQGHPELDGFAWYRKRVAIPTDWKSQRLNNFVTLLVNIAPGRHLLPPDPKRA